MSLLTKLISIHEFTGNLVYGGNYVVWEAVIGAEMDVLYSIRFFDYTMWLWLVSVYQR